MSTKKRSAKKSAKNGTPPDEPAVLRLNKTGKIKIKDIRKAVLAVRDKRAIAER